ncbi:hypothetical protein [uncultured Rubinisphaera sp.]|uniref:hypothetical protein n=1 Tax=uncultured Rubinisphaera sp. TaxID=1678686 RepID=UPI0030DA773D|tara:strand:+ start:3403 stop:4299 length:897 start_codon:yes stop_codon:yes gene_type:complete
MIKISPANLDEVKTAGYSLEDLKAASQLYRRWLYSPWYLIEANERGEDEFDFKETEFSKAFFCISEFSEQIALSTGSVRDIVSSRCLLPKAQLPALHSGKTMFQHLDSYGFEFDHADHCLKTINSWLNTELTSCEHYISAHEAAIWMIDKIQDFLRVIISNAELLHVSAPRSVMALFDLCIDHSECQRISVLADREYLYFSDQIQSDHELTDQEESIAQEDSITQEDPFLESFSVWKPTSYWCQQVFRIANQTLRRREIKGEYVSESRYGGKERRFKMRNIDPVWRGRLSDQSAKIST